MCQSVKSNNLSIFSDIKCVITIANTISNSLLILNPFYTTVQHIITSQNTKCKWLCVIVCVRDAERLKIKQK